MKATGRRVLVAVVTDEGGAGLLVQHPRFAVVFTAPNGTERTAVDHRLAPVDDGGMAPPLLLLDVAEVARRLSLSERLARTLIAGGALPSVRVGRRRLVRAEDLGQFVERLGDDRRTPTGGTPSGPDPRTAGPAGHPSPAPELSDLGTL